MGVEAGVAGGSAILPPPAAPSARGGTIRPPPPSPRGAAGFSLPAPPGTILPDAAFTYTLPPPAPPQREGAPEGVMVLPLRVFAWWACGAGGIGRITQVGERFLEEARAMAGELGGNDERFTP